MSSVDWHVVATSYLGIALVGASYLGIGIVASALAKSQLIALLLSIAVQFGLFILGIGEYILDPGPLRELSAHLSLSTLLEETSKGLIDTRRIVFHVSLTLWSLFVATRLVEAWRDD